MRKVKLGGEENQFYISPLFHFNLRGFKAQTLEYLELMCFRDHEENVRITFTSLHEHMAGSDPAAAC